MPLRFVETGITFECDEANCFRIELDSLVKVNHCKGSTNGVRACEFVTYIGGRHVFVEAKSSAPRGAKGALSEKLPDNWVVYDNFQCYLRDISKKFSDSLALLSSIQTNRHGEARKNALPLPAARVSLDNLKFILVINFQNSGPTLVDKDGLNNLQYALRNEMRPYLRLLNIPDTSVVVVCPDDGKRLLHLPIV